MMQKTYNYLIKFVSKKEYADDLINGNFYMNTAKYFHSLEGMQGDGAEAAVSHQSMIFKNTHAPIFCMYTVYTDQIVNGCVKVPRKLIEDFNAKYAVVINAQRLELLLSSNKLQTRFGFVFGVVGYKILTLEDTIALFQDKQMTNLFIKRPYFLQQQEYRIGVNEYVPDELEQMEFEGTMINKVKENGHKTYRINKVGSFSSFCKLVDLDSVSKIEDNVIIDCRGV